MSLQCTNEKLTLLLFGFCVGFLVLGVIQVLLLHP